MAARVPPVRREAILGKWSRSMGWPPRREHYRDPRSTQHAVCGPEGEECQVHEDRFNPNRGPKHAVLHLFVDFLSLPLRRLGRGKKAR